MGNHGEFFSFFTNDINWEGYGSWDGFLERNALRPHLELLTGFAPSIYDTPTPSHSWEPIHQRMQAEIRSSYRYLTLKNGSVTERFSAKLKFKGEGVYVLGRVGNPVDYPTAPSSPIYIGKSHGMSGQVIRRVCDHYFAPESEYTLVAFGHGKTQMFFSTEREQKHYVILFQNLQLKRPSRNLEALVLRSFERKYGSCPRYNSMVPRGSIVL